MTISQTPGTYYSAHDPLMFVVYDSHAADPTTYTNYKYVCDIYIGGVLITRQKAVPLPTSNRGVFNISPVVRAYVQATFSPASGISAQALGSGEFFIEVQCKFGEEYADTTYTNSVVDTARVYYNHYNGRLVNATSALTDKANKVASNRCDTTIKLVSGRHFLSYFPSASGNVTVETKTYDYSNTIVSTVSDSVAMTALTLKIIDVSPVTLNSVHASLISDTTKYYTVKVGSTSIYRFDLACQPKYTSYTLHFLNQYGGFDSYEFRMVSRKEINVEKKEYNQNSYRVSDSGTLSFYDSNNVYHEQRTPYAVKYKEKLKLTTDFLSDDEYTWLADLIKSPMVYLEDSGYFVPVIINQSSYEYKKRINDKLTPLVLDIEYGQDQNTQFR